MAIIYFAHSYRAEDAAIVRYFGELVAMSGLVPILDPPSEGVNAARLQRILRDSDGMVAVLTRRQDGVSPHILFEIALCLQARKPLLIFVEDVVATDDIPSRVLRSRFSRRWYFRQYRDHRHSVDVFRAYLGDHPPPRYQPQVAPPTCWLIGGDAINPELLSALSGALNKFGYTLALDQQHDGDLRSAMQLSERLACSDLVIDFIDSKAASDLRMGGAARAAFIPRIQITFNSEAVHDLGVPSDYLPRYIDNPDPVQLREVLARELRLFEQSFAELDTADEVDTYVNLLVETSKSGPDYGARTRSVFVGALKMGDQYNINQAGAVGPNAHAHDMSFQQIWAQQGKEIDLSALAAELGKLRAALRTEAETAEQDVELGQVALAEAAARKGDGPSALGHLKSVGKWGLATAEKIGVAVAAGAIKTAMGL